MRPVASRMGWIVVLLIVAIAGFLFTAHEFFPPLDPPGSGTATK